MRTFTCNECGFSYSEADKHWGEHNSTSPCPKCAFALTKVTNKNAKKIKLSIVSITVFLIVFAVWTNGKSTISNFILIVAIWFFMVSYILPFIEKKDMHGSMTYIEYNQDNLVVRFIFMAFSVVVIILALYKLLLT